MIQYEKTLGLHFVGKRNSFCFDSRSSLVPSLSTVALFSLLSKRFVLVVAGFVVRVPTHSLDVNL